MRNSPCLAKNYSTPNSPQKNPQKLIQGASPNILNINVHQCQNWRTPTFFLGAVKPSRLRMEVGRWFMLGLGPGHQLGHILCSLGSRQRGSTSHSTMSTVIPTWLLSLGTTPSHCCNIQMILFSCNVDKTCKGRHCMHFNGWLDKLIVSYVLRSKWWFNINGQWPSYK